MPKTIYLTVTNSLSYDQRMARICSSLSAAGYRVILVGRNVKDAPSLVQKCYYQKRLNTWFSKGKLFYVVYNFRLFFYLLFKNANAICAIDLDTIVPCLLVSKLKNIPRIYDAHELFTEMKEVVSRPKIHKVWLWVERKCVPQFLHGYTVNTFIAAEMNRRYGVNYSIVRNLPVKKSVADYVLTSQEKTILDSLPPAFFLYQGAVNEGRSFETLIPAMKTAKLPLVVAGDGNFMPSLKRLIAENDVSEKVVLLGAVEPALLRQITPKAYCGITLFESTGLNQYYSLANRFFDYIQAQIPQLCVAYPEYEAVNNQYDIALLTDDLTSAALTAALNKLVDDRVLYERLQQNCLSAAQKLCWENEQQVLLQFYKKLLN